MNKFDPFNIARLLLAYHKKDIDANDKATLEKAFEELSGLKEINEELDDKSKIAGEIFVMSSFNTEKALGKISPSKSKVYLMYQKIAAAIALLLIGLASAYFILNRPERQSFYTESTLNNDSKVTLRLENGDVLSLDTLSSYIAGEEIALDNKNGTLSVTDKLAQLGKNEVNKINSLEIPYKTTYKLVLQDGTKVWLNSGSKLDFPSDFDDNQRLVKLTGEAYFEVTHDENRKFVIETNGLEIAVLGTSFNVKSYTDENMVYTTLVNGSVAVGDNTGNLIRISPGEQACFDRNNHKINVKNVDVNLFSAWKDGMFYFEDASLDDIMRRLGRWYGLDIVYIQPKLKNIVYSGKMRMYDSVNDVLRKFEKSGELGFRLENNSIYIDKRD